MKRSIRILVFVLGGCTTLLLSNCQKKVTDLKPTPPVDSFTVNAMYPVSQSKNEDFAYVYNDKGYQTQITINTTYFNATVTHHLTTYNYTYK